MLDGDPAPPPTVPPIFGPHPLRPNGCIDQDATWYGGRPRPRRLCARWEPAPLPQKGAEPPIFGPFLLSPNGWMHQDATWYGGMPQPRRLCVRWGPTAASPPLKGHSPPNFRPMSVVGKRLDRLRWHLLWRYASAQATW